MGAIIDSFTSGYRQNGYYIKKKSEYTFVFFLLMSIYSILNLGIEYFTRNRGEWLLYTLAFYIVCQILMFTFLYFGRLQISQYLFFILGVAVGLRYMVLETHYQFYTHLVILLIVGITIHISRIQMLIVYSYVNIIALVRAYFLYTLISAGYISDVMLNQSFQATIGIFLFSLIIAYFNKMINSGIMETKELGEISVMDSLTHLSNRSRFNIRVGELIDNESNFLLAMLDIDYFKKINDKLGHEKGDYVLITLANLMRDYFDDTYELFRWGGEEFAVIVADDKLEAFNSRLNDFKEQVSDWDFGLDYPLTISGGIYMNTTGESLEQTVINADNALYDAKIQGRDCIIISEVVNQHE